MEGFLRSSHCKRGGRKDGLNGTLGKTEGGGEGQGKGTNWGVELFSFNFSLLERRSWSRSNRHGREHVEGEERLSLALWVVARRGEERRGKGKEVMGRGQLSSSSSSFPAQDSDELGETFPLRLLETHIHSRLSSASPYTAVKPYAQQWKRRSRTSETTHNDGSSDFFFSPSYHRL